MSEPMVFDVKGPALLGVCGCGNPVAVHALRSDSLSTDDAIRDFISEGLTVKYAADGEPVQIRGCNCELPEIYEITRDLKKRRREAERADREP